MTSDIHSDPATNVALCGGQSMVFHCHFYNCALEEAIERGLGADATRVQEQAARAAVKSQLSALAAGSSGEPVYRRAAELFARFGFGTLDCSELGAKGGVVRVPHSHYAMGWVATRGERSTPACAFVTGFIAATAIVAHGLDSERVRATEIECFARGDASCAFRVEVV
jgi:predicted hydrocarbon binding protein